nr:unnamed protein product [Callosobruchus chinensis]
MESLKGSFRREKSRVKKGTGTGKGRDQIYISKWFAYESMQFLDDRDDPQKTVTVSIFDFLKFLYCY